MNNSRYIIIVSSFIFFAISCTNRQVDIFPTCYINKIEVSHWPKVKKDSVRMFVGYYLYLNTTVVNNTDDTIFMPPLGERTSFHNSYITAKIGNKIIKLNKLHGTGTIFPSDSMEILLLAKINEPIPSEEVLIKQIKNIKLTYRYDEKNINKIIKEMKFVRMPNSLKIEKDYDYKAIHVE